MAEVAGDGADSRNQRSKDPVVRASFNRRRGCLYRITAYVLRAGDDSGSSRRSRTNRLGHEPSLGMTGTTMEILAIIMPTMTKDKSSVIVYPSVACSSNFYLLSRANIQKHQASSMPVTQELIQST